VLARVAAVWRDSSYLRKPFQSEAAQSGKQLSDGYNSDGRCSIQHLLTAGPTLVSPASCQLLFSTQELGQASLITTIRLGSNFLNGTAPTQLCVSIQEQMSRVLLLWSTPSLSVLVVNVLIWL